MSGREAPKGGRAREPVRGLGEDPLSPDALLEETFYRSPSSKNAVRTPPKKERPSHYKVISISMYLDDIVRLEAMVAELKQRGFTKANKSQLIRFALSTVDLDAMPRGYE